jgi:hypothetical protein
VYNKSYIAISGSGGLEKAMKKYMLFSELVPKSVILSPALAVSQAKALRNRVFQGYSSKI